MFPPDHQPRKVVNATTETIKESAGAGINEEGDGAGLLRADVCKQTPPTLTEAAPYLTHLLFE